MKEDVVSKEKLIGPQLVVQSYLDELLQEATIETKGPAVEFETSELNEVDLLSSEINEDIESEPSVLEAIDVKGSNEESISTLPVKLNETVNDVKDELSIDETTIEDSSSSEDTEDKIAVENSDGKLSESKVTTNEIESELAVIEPKVLREKTGPLPWAESRFECLLFNVGGLKIAVPLIELGGIQKADKESITSMFGQPDWFIGISSVNDLRIRTVNTAKWVMPDHDKGKLSNAFQFIIQLDRSDWGLACDEVAEAITLEPSEVKWRSDRSKRPWLAGTVIKHMCAILDVQGFIELLEDPKNGFNPTLK